MFWSVAGHSRCCRGGAGWWDRTAEVAVVARRHSDWGCQGATAFPFKPEHPGVMEAPAETAWFPWTPTHQCCPDCWESARRKRRKQRSEDAVRWDYNQELLQEREIEVWEYHGENAVSLLYKADQTGVIRSLSNSLDIPFPTVESVGFAHLLNSARSSGPSSLP